MAYWDVVSKTFKDNPFVIGYDPINEPFPGNNYEDLALVLEPGYYDETRL